ncbi:MAG: hypothetical protein FWH18_07880 [Marinilabiliaceae bacterium]|nr:hypothetical protein [Marinilabiliaceae bacterium]
MKKLVCFILGLIPLQFAFSQDIIVTTNQDTIFCKILMVSSKYIRFQEKVATGQTVAKFIEKNYVSEYHKNKYPTSTPARQNQNLQENAHPSKKYQLSRHEFSISAGSNFGVKIFEGDPKNQIKNIQSFTLSYHKRIDDSFWFGVQSTATLIEYSNSDIYYGSEPYDSYLSHAASLRVSYFNTPNAMLYLRISLGIGFMGAIVPFFHITPFGFSFGNHFFASGELGFGMQGFFGLNAGYRF